MSRYYSMAVEIRGYDPQRTQAIKAAATAEWPSLADGWFEVDGEMSSSGDGSLAFGETEKEFSRRMARAIMLANGGPCEVCVQATCLEDLPYETYVFEKDPDVYAALVAEECKA